MFRKVEQISKKSDMVQLTLFSPLYVYRFGHLPCALPSTPCCPPLLLQPRLALGPRPSFAAFPMSLPGNASSARVTGNPLRCIEVTFSEITGQFYWGRNRNVDSYRTWYITLTSCFDITVKIISILRSISNLRCKV